MQHKDSSACRCGIDTHAHVVPQDFPAYVGSRLPADWPSMAPAQPCHRSVMLQQGWGAFPALRDSVQRIDAAGFGPATVAALVHRNAERFLGLTKEIPA